MVYKDDKKELSKLSIHDVNTKKYRQRVYQEAKGVIIGKSTELLELEIFHIIKNLDSLLKEAVKYFWQGT